MKEDIRKGRLWKELRDYKDCFWELSIQEGVILRGDRIVIPRSLRTGVLEAAHQGYPGKESMTRQIRQLCWWPRVSSDIGEFADMPSLHSCSSKNQDGAHADERC